MGRCNHVHQQTTADVWTKLATAGEATASFISDAYWLGGLIDLAAQLDDAGYGLSWYGMGFGAAIALLTAAGSAYSHTALNLNHQHHPAEHAEEDREREPLLKSSQHERQHQAANITIPQKIALAGDFISHVGDIAGPITFVADIIAKDRLPLWGKALIQCGATLFGGVASVANVRSCRNSMYELNAQQHEHAHSRHA